MNNDGVVRSYDAVLAVQIAIELRSPTAYELWAGDMNGDGSIGIDDAILILNKALGRAAPERGIIVKAGGKYLTVTIPEAHGVAGESITVPLNIDNIDELGGGDICITYDPAVLRAVDVSSDSGVLLVSNVSKPGEIRVALVKAGRLSSGTIADIKFEILTDAVSPLAFKSMELYNPDALPLKSRGIAQKFISWAVPAENDALLQNFPNPFNPETWIPYQLREDSEITVRIYSMSGELVRELDLGHKPAGLYVNRDRAAYWDGRNASGEEVASGTYFYSIRTGDFSAVRKMIVLR